MMLLDHDACSCWHLHAKLMEQV